MIKNIKTALLISSVVGGTLLSCNDHDFGADYNKDVYGTYTSDYKSLLTGAIMDFGTTGGASSQVYQMMPNLFSQHWAQVTYTTEQCYGDTPGGWSRFYANQLQNLNFIIEKYSGTVTPEMTLQGSKENMIGVSKIMKSIIMKRVTDTYGDAPYSESNKYAQGVYLPKYDKQQDIYKALIEDLKAGRDMLNTATKAPTGDVLYYGSLTKWKKLANSVILQATLQLQGTSLDAWAKTEFNSALSNSAGVIQNVADEAWFTISPTSTYPNPYSAFRSADYKISRQLVESLKGASNTFNRTSNHTADVRLTLYSTNGTMSATGLPYGYNSSDLAAAGYSASSATTVSTRFRSNNSPMNLMTAGYTYLNRAEAAAIGWTTENAATLLELGIVKNYETLDSNYVTGVSPFTGNKISTLVNTTTGNPYLTDYKAARVADMTTYGAQRVICEEKWIALFMNGFDAWTEFRRTGYPNLLPAPSALNGGVIPRRMRYPQEEASFNNANYLKGLQSLTPGEDKNTSKVWWDQ